MKRLITHRVGSKPKGPSALSRLAVTVGAALSGQKTYTVPNQAMVSTLRIRQVVSFDPAAYKDSPISRGDIIVYRSEKHDGLLLPSRVVALENESVEIRDRVLYVDGNEIAEPYVDRDAANEPYSRTLGRVVVPPGHLFLLGDFRDMSEDSRFIGPVHQALIMGRVSSIGRSGEA